MTLPPSLRRAEVDDVSKCLLQTRTHAQAASRGHSLGVISSSAAESTDSSPAESASRPSDARAAATPRVSNVPAAVCGLWKSTPVTPTLWACMTALVVCSCVRSAVFMIIVGIETVVTAVSVA